MNGRTREKGGEEKSRSGFLSGSLWNGYSTRKVCVPGNPRRGRAVRQVGDPRVAHVDTGGESLAEEDARGRDIV